MVVSKIKEVLNKFLSSEDRVILINGPWGCGKTYSIKEFLEENSENKKIKIAYVSLFGKSSVDEIHTEIYNKYHPVKKWGAAIVGVIPKITAVVPNEKAGTIGNIIESINCVLKIKADKKAKKKQIKNETNLIIFDDFERMNFENISTVDFLGYLNSLVLQNFKIVVVGNEKELLENKNIIEAYKDFKEKIFDSEYRISATNREIIDMFFSDKLELLQNYVVDEFNNNLRTAKKVNSFYNKVIDLLKGYNEEYMAIQSEQTILYCCALVIAGTNNQYSECRPVEVKENNYVLDLIAYKSKDSNVQQIAEEVYWHLNKRDTIYTEIQVIIALLRLYYFNDEEQLFELFASRKQRIVSPLLNSAFYLSDSGKRELFEKQYKAILNGDEVLSGKLKNTISNMYMYEQFSNIKTKEDILISGIISNYETYKEDISSIITYPEKDLKEFKIKLEIAEKDYIINCLINDLRTAWENKNYLQINDCFVALRHNEVFKDKNKLCDKIFNVIKDYNFFIDDLYGDIDEPIWGTAHGVCRLAKTFGFQKQVIEYIESLDCEGDCSAEYRYSILRKTLNGEEIE